jgi:putative component of membrane protein insertase Oxa1/YidC/SpoIIIJ protein YidD
MNNAQKLIINSVKKYQKYISPDHSFWAKAKNNVPYCKHIPTCSQYMIEAVEKKGAIL